uniref:Uncharacterized protein n=1 Tax=Arundo donax TaxID=35708 RepID=A0A0A9AMM8_ARUDO
MGRNGRTVALASGPEGCCGHR